MKNRFLIIILVSTLILSFTAMKNSIGKMLEKEFVKSCNNECVNSPNRYKSNIKEESKKPTDQCQLIKYYSEMLYEGTKNKTGAELILEDICPKTLHMRQ